jgi:Mg-chelatase subunit ChlD
MGDRAAHRGLNHSADRSFSAARRKAMPDQPNKPGGDFHDDGTPRDAEDEQAVKNQSQVKPEDYEKDNVGRATGKNVT